MTPAFVHLHVHSEYSLVDSVVRIKPLVRAVADTMPAVALTDQSNLMGAVKFYRAAMGAGVKPILAVDAWVAESPEDDDPHRLVLLSQGDIGYKNLCELVSLSYTEGQRRGIARMQREWLTARSTTGLIALCGQSGDVGRAIVDDRDDDAFERLEAWRTLFGDRFYLELQRTGRANETRFVQGAAACENTLEIAQRCNTRLTLGAPVLPDFPVPAGMTESDYICTASQRGLDERLLALYPDEAERNMQRVAYDERLRIELDVINGMGFPGYFLIVADFIEWSKNNAIPVGPGRGSGAGSLVAWALKITDIDPLPYDLLFERFLNPERVSMPDFDVDFCIAGRDRVIQYVSDTYGAEKVSQIITYGTMAAKADCAERLDRFLSALLRRRRCQPCHAIRQGRRRSRRSREVRFPRIAQPHDHR